LSGLAVKDDQNPHGDIEFETTGLRPCEKLYEELLICNNPELTSHPRIMKAHEDFLTWVTLEDKLSALEVALNINDVSVVRIFMQELVQGYTPSDEIVDWVYLEQGVEGR
jgi:FlaA1/EpsC-like NDP-sugar epimerase